MNLKDAIDYVEGQFTCQMGAPWCWADLALSKPYQMVRIERPLSSDEAATQNLLVAKFIDHVKHLKSQAGYGFQERPKLYWRWSDKVRWVVEDGQACIQSRFYIDGNPGIQHSNPSKPRGRPTVGQIRLAA